MHNQYKKLTNEIFYILFFLLSLYPHCARQCGPATFQVLYSHRELGASGWTVQLEATTRRREAACCLSVRAFALVILTQLLICSKTLLCVHFLGSVVRSWQVACKPEEIGRNFSPLWQAEGSHAGVVCF